MGLANRGRIQEAMALLTNYYVTPIIGSVRTPYTYAKDGYFAMDCLGAGVRSGLDRENVYVLIKLFLKETNVFFFEKKSSVLINRQVYMFTLTKLKEQSKTYRWGIHRCIFCKPDCRRSSGLANLQYPSKTFVEFRPSSIHARKFQKITTFRSKIRKTISIRLNCKNSPLLREFVAMYTDSQF
jgi:hypothetical protein